MKSFKNRRDFLIGLCAGILLAGLCFFTVIAIHFSGAFSTKQDLSNRVRPHSPYLIERDTMDGGFSRGWMPHFLPSEEYWIDAHVHMNNVTDAENMKCLLDEWFAKTDAFRLSKVVAIIANTEQFRMLGETAGKDARFAWIFWPQIDAPSLSLVREAVRNGACGIKLINKSLMEGKVPRTIWQSNEWQEIFSFAETNGIPLLWHVTQRHGYSPYHGGGLYPYWQEGWTKGVDFTNEDMLQDMLAIMRRYPKLKVIGAHQLHIGLERLQQLLQEYDNLYIDSSCGMYLRWADDFIEEDRIVLRDFIEHWSKRILFGTDANMQSGYLDEYALQGFLCHTRFMLKLGLNDEALQDVAWRTAQQLLNLKPGNSARRGNVRP